MTFKLPRLRYKIPSASAFTIFEMLMVLAVMGIAITLFIVNIDRSLASVANQSVNDIVFAAVRKARLTAVTSKQEVRLIIEEDTLDLMLYDSSRQVIGKFSFDEADKPYIEAINLWPVRPILMKDASRQSQKYELSDQMLSEMVFESTGISSLLAFEIVYTHDIGESDFILVDPFSNGEIAGGLD